MIGDSAAIEAAKIYAVGGSVPLVISTIIISTAIPALVDDILKGVPAKLLSVGTGMIEAEEVPVAFVARLGLPEVLAAIFLAGGPKAVPVGDATGIPTGAPAIGS